MKKRIKVIKHDFFLIYQPSPLLNIFQNPKIDKDIAWKSLKYDFCGKPCNIRPNSNLMLPFFKYEKKQYEASECGTDVDVCMGPLIKYAVFDAFIGSICAIILIFGALGRSVCMLIIWMMVIPCASIKYVWVLHNSNWTQYEDYISLMYLCFYFSVYIVVWSLFREIRTKQ